MMSTQLINEEIAYTCKDIATDVIYTYVEEKKKNKLTTFLS